MLETITFKRERLAAAASDQFLAATDIADLLVRRGVPFREAHGVVAGLVRQAAGRRQAALGAHPGGADRAVVGCSTRSSTGCSRTAAWLETKVSEGGTALARVREQLERARAALR